MDDEREKGRVAGWLSRLDKTLAFAQSMVSAFGAAHQEAPATLRGYADWLNRRNFKNERGKVWRAETVSRLFAVDVRARDLAAKAFEIETARRRFLKLDTSDIEARKREYVERATALAEKLRGPWKPVVDRSKDLPMG